jgi:hypothetical protein
LVICSTIHFFFVLHRRLLSGNELFWDIKYFFPARSIPSTPLFRKWETAEADRYCLVDRMEAAGYLAASHHRKPLILARP